MLTVFRAASKAPGPVWRMSSGVDRVVAQLELADVVLRVDDVADQLVVRVLGVGREEGVAVRPLDAVDPAEDRDHRRLVAVADVVLAAVGAASRRRRVRREDHVGRVDVGAVGPLGEPEGEDLAVLEQPRGPRPGRLVLGHEDRPEPEDRDLPRVPVGEPVEGGDLVERADPLRVPAPLGIAAAVARRASGSGRRSPPAPGRRGSREYQRASRSASLSATLPRVLEPLDRRLDRVAVAGLEVVEPGSFGSRIRPSPEGARGARVRTGHFRSSPWGQPIPVEGGAAARPRTALSARSASSRCRGRRRRGPRGAHVAVVALAPRQLDRRLLVVLVGDFVSSARCS